MKKLIYMSAIVCLNIIVFGGLFKVMHWPGANLLLTIGMLSFAFVILPLAFINSYKAEQNSKAVYIAGFISVFAFLVMGLFKILHWPGAGPMLVLCITLPIVLFLPIFIRNQRKLNTENNTNLIGVMFLLVYYSIFSALLSLNVSKDVLNAFIINTDLVSNTNISLMQKNDAEYQKIDSLNHNEKLLKSKKLSEEMINYIHQLKTDLIVRTEFVDPKIADTFQAADLKAKDNYDIPTRLLIGEDQVAGKGGKAEELKNKLLDYKNQMILLSNNEQFKQQIDNLFDLSDKVNISTEQKWNWEMNNFYHTIFIAVIYNLNTLEMNVRIAESEAIQTLKK